jgi:homoserine O-acetyltransferase
MAAQEFLFSFPARVNNAILIGTSPYLSKLNCVMNLEQIIAIENDPNFNNGDYYDGKKPERGLMLARMIAHKNYVDIDQIEKRAKAEIRKTKNNLSYDLRHSLESYMLRQGEKFVDRFDANSYLRILMALQDFNLAQDYGNGNLLDAFKGIDSKIQIFSINTDYCCYPEEQVALKKAFEQNGTKVDFRIVDSEKGHDSFLLEPEKYIALKWFLEK